MPGRNYEDNSPLEYGERRSSHFSPRGENGTSNGYSRGENGLAGQDSGNGSSGAHVYSVDHLVSWSIGAEHGVLTHQDGMRQLSRMEKKTGIFTMRCLLTVDSSSVQIVDGQSGNAMELFPLECVREPVAVKDKTGMFNNIALFTVVDEPKNKHSLSDMHIFQVVGREASELADDIAEAIAAHNSKPQRSSHSQQPTAGPSAVNTHGNGNTSEPLSVKDAINKFELTGHQDSGERSPVGKSKEQIPVSKRTLEAEGDNEEDVQLGVALLNRCFDDVERFVLRLKHSAKAFQELSSRKKHSKSRKFGDGMLTMRSKTPAPAEFVECFQKVKLSFNLLTRLRLYLHNPNSTELVHFLFTPLSLLVEASNDPRFDIRDLVGKVVTPLLSWQAVEMLANCLTSKEFEFWSSLGESWTVPKHKYTHKQAQEFRPTFSDGYQPPESWLEMFLGDVAKLAAKQAIDRRAADINDDDLDPSYTGLPNGMNGESRAAERRVSATPPSGAASRPSDIPLYTSVAPASNRKGSTPDRPNPWDDYQKKYLTTLLQRNARVYEAIQDKKGNNAKELTIRKGEIVEVLDDSRNWWKCSNINGDQGFIPYTLLTKYEHMGSLPSPYSPRSSISSASPAPAPLVPDPPPPPPPPAPPAINSNWKLTKPTRSSKAEKGKSTADASDTRSDEFNLELKNRLRQISLESSNASSRFNPVMSPQVFIDSHSSADEVADWLKQKGFLEQTRHVLSGYNGSELFHLSSDSLMSEFGQAEGSRLVSQIKLMKTTAGYTQSGSSQLRKILERRKQRSDVVDDRSDDSDELASASALRSSAGRKY
ncbi:epidermal growth factor receptor kinase substrate 8-like isoform X2 [Watersipora subatra]|uniref:epidermal growth factor receptor kinase substrate 8-like isoform X2 n=1 Tax=Watersipora subatra TaxID=2589382 RepID=UPI00355C9D39